MLDYEGLLDDIAVIISLNRKDRNSIEIANLIIKLLKQQEDNKK